jgi:hypothetical protein
MECWNIGKLGIKNPKSQAPPDLKIGSNKSQISIFNDRNRFGI